MYHQYREGYIEVICGCMFAGKTEELIRRINVLSYAKQKILVFKPKIDKNKMMNEDNDLHPGDMVNHDKYGFGVVVTIDGSIATISFKRDGLKKLMKNHKSIHKM